MGLCYAPDCDHTNKHGCKMFKFPQDPTLKKKWESLIRRGDRSPTKFSLVCSCHFEEGRKENLPTMFKRNQDKKFKFSSPEKRKRVNRSDIVEEIPPISSTSQLSSPTTADEASTSSKQTGSISLSGPVLQAENYFLTEEVEVLKNKLSKLKLYYGVEHLVSDHLVSIYTGLPNIKIFNCLYEYVSGFPIKYCGDYDIQKITKKDQLLLCLMKLKLNLLYDDLAVRFGISKSLVSDICVSWINVLHYSLFEVMLKKKFPSKEKIQSCLPSSFSSFTNCRIILDCTEIYTEVPHRLDSQRATYSSYKHRNTLKGLVGVAPNGVVIFISSLYVGSTSDKKIVQSSGVLDNLNAGDLIVADKGFLISDILPAGVSLNIPPFLVNAQFNDEEIQQTEVIARARIHVERAIRRMKVFKILNLIPHQMRPYSSKLFQVVGCLTNLNYPLIKEVESEY